LGIVEFLSSLEPLQLPSGFRTFKVLTAFQHGRRPSISLGTALRLDPAAEASQRLPAEVARTLIAGASLTVAVFTAARTKSLAVGLAQRLDGQGQKHLLAQHVFKRKTVS
jgi:hypothetical protein